MKGLLLLYAGFVIASTVAAVVIGSYIAAYASPEIGTIVVLGLFFTGLVVSWIATVFVMDGSLRNFHAEQEQIEAIRACPYAPSWVGNSCNRRNAVAYSARCGIGDYRRLRLSLMLEFPQLRSDLFKSNKINRLVAFQATRPVLSQPFARRASHRPLPPITVGLRSTPPEMYQSPPSVLHTAHWGRQVDQFRGGPTCDEVICEFLIH